MTPNSRTPENSPVSCISRRTFPAGTLAILIWVLLCARSPVFGAAPTVRSNLVEAILSEDLARQTEIIRGFATSGDAFVEQTLTAWRGGSLYIFETNDTKTPFLLEAHSDGEGRAKGLRVLDASPLLDDAGNPMLFSGSELAPVDTSSKQRKVIKTTLDLFAVGNPNPKIRRDAITKLGQDQNPDYLSFFEARLKVEKDKEVIKALHEAIAVTGIASEIETIRVAAVEKLGVMRSITSLPLLEILEKSAKAAPARFGEKTTAAVRKSVYDIENYMRWGTFFGTAFRGISLAAVLLVAALGLAITFGLMGVINMAHGEIIMVGAYSAYVTQNVFTRWFGASGGGFDSYFIAALLVSFIAASCVGLLLERGVIRFLYKRPLESLLATWGVSLVLQQIFRHTFGAANVQVSSPSWLSGSFVVNDVLLAYNRLFVIAFAVFVVLLTYLLLTRTSLGLQIRAVMQNRNMASALGVRTDRVNMMTFAFGSGLAGMAGACLSQIGNVGPSLGQAYIVDCFMIVVLGGVGNLVGTVSASLGVGVTDQILQPWLGAVLGKISVLAAIILFLQWRPAGIFVTRSRSLEG